MFCPSTKPMTDPDTDQLILDFKKACTTLSEKAQELQEDACQRSPFDIEEIGLYLEEAKRAISEVERLYDALSTDF